MVRIILTDEALSDISSAALYYESILEGLGTRFRNALQERIADISLHALHYSYISFDDKKIYRSVFLKKFPYQIIYQWLTEEVIIYGVFHAKRRPSYIRRRLPKG
jgi:plasmid stabilization system protein ParE